MLLIIFTFSRTAVSDCDYSFGGSGLVCGAFSLFAHCCSLIRVKQRF